MSGVIVGRYSTIGEAGIARSALAAAGIDAAAVDEQMVGINWLYSDAIGGVKLLVHERDGQRAESVLLGLDEGFDGSLPESAIAEAAPLADGAGSEETERLRCPDCGSAEVARTPRLRLFLFLALAGSAAGLAVGQTGLGLTAAAVAALVIGMLPTHRCASCGERWSPTPKAPPAVDYTPPELSDTLENPCPRCGSIDFYRIDWRRLKAIPLLVKFTALIVFPLWLVLPEWRCEECGLRA
jgi:DNA-directed RNA polymerase subunit RPC12/RpoP